MLCLHNEFNFLVFFSQYSVLLTLEEVGYIYCIAKKTAPKTPLINDEYIL